MAGKKHRVFVVFEDPGRAGEKVKEMVFAAITPKQALINAVLQYGGNYRTDNYPSDIEGIIKSKTKERYYYELGDGMIAYTVC